MRHIKKTIFKKDIIIVMICFLAIFTFSCKKLVEVDPPITSINGGNVFNDNLTAISAITGIYTNMSNNAVNTSNGWLTNIFFTTGLLSDELTLWYQGNSALLTYANNTLSPNEFPTWANSYNVIFVCNSAIEGLNESENVTPAVKQQLLGESYFMRGLTYFYLVNMYGDVPLSLTTDYKVNRSLARANKVLVYQQIVTDLAMAQKLLSVNFLSKTLLTNTTERVRPTKWAATALLARVYLYQGSNGDNSAYEKAEKASTEIIDNAAQFSLVQLNSAFLKNNREAIWQLQPVGTAGDNNANSKEGQVLVLPADGPNSYLNQVYLSDDLYNSFEPNDQRKSQWIANRSLGGQSFNYAYKYKIGAFDNLATAEYSTVLRLGEQYLIRAEARIQQGKLSDGISDLNTIRNRATDLLAIPGSRLPQLELTLSKDIAIAAVENERRHELFCEWGHRWFDLKRTNRVNSILGFYKGTFWQSTDQLLPIPQYDIQQNPNLLGHQNPGY